LNVEDNLLQPPERAKRIKRNFIARIRLYHNNTGQKDAPKWNIVTMQNLSSTGILFNYNQKIPINTVLEFIISLPFNNNVHCLGVVRRIEGPPLTKKTKKFYVYRIAAYFIKLDTHIKESLDNFAEEIESEICQ